MTTSKSNEILSKININFKNPKKDQNFIKNWLKKEQKSHDPSKVVTCNFKNEPLLEFVSQFCENSKKTTGHHIFVSDCDQKIQKFTKKPSNIRQDFDWLWKYTKKSIKTNKQLDYLRLSIKNPIFFENSMFKDYVDNSNFKIRPSSLYEVQSTMIVSNERHTIFMFSINHPDWTYSLFRVSRYESKNPLFNRWTFGQVDIYWTFFRLWTTKQIDMSFFAEIWLPMIPELKITRIDYAIDFFWSDEVSINDLFDPKHQWSNTHYRDFSKEWSSTWRQFWFSDTGKKSNICFSRCYDKKIDIKRNNKELLYSDYMNFPWNIRRLEFQFWSRFCCARWDFSISSFEPLLLQIQEYLWLQEKTWLFTKRYTSMTDLSLVNEMRKKLYIKWTNSRIETITKSFWERTAFMLLQKSLSPIFEHKIWSKK